MFRAEQADEYPGRYTSHPGIKRMLMSRGDARSEGGQSWKAYKWVSTAVCLHLKKSYTPHRATHRPSLENTQKYTSPVLGQDTT